MDTDTNEITVSGITFQLKILFMYMYIAMSIQPHQAHVMYTESNS